MRSFCLFTVCIMLSGCMTVTRGPTEEISIISSPVGATASAEILKRTGGIDTKAARQYQCRPTPCQLSLPRTGHARITVSKDGFQPIQFLAVSKGSSPTSTIRPGTVVAGMAPGSMVRAGTPETITKYLSGNTLTALQILTFYGTAGTVIDKMSGANRSFSPNPVTVELAPIEQGEAP